MNIEIDLNRLKRSGLNANQYVVLYLMYYKNFKLIKELFSVSDATAIRNSLIDTEYILDKTSDQKFTQTIKSTIKNKNLC